MAVLVGLVASKCGEDEYDSSYICIQHCSFKISDGSPSVLGTCIISSRPKIHTEAGDVYQQCWKCTADPLN